MKGRIVGFLNETIGEIQNVSFSESINSSNEASVIKDTTPAQNTETNLSQDTTNVIDNSVDVQVQGDNNNVTINQYINTDK